MDQKGKAYKLDIFDSEVITNRSRSPVLTQSDLDFVNSLNLPLSFPADDNTETQILIGCDHLWEFVEGKTCKLPSGLHLIETKFGHMVSGKPSPQATDTQAVTPTYHDSDSHGPYRAIKSSETDEFKRPINVLIPLELPQDNVRQPRQEQAAESREHTTHTTHGKQQTLWEQTARQSDGNARYNLRKKPAVPYCPYNEQEYEVNCITSQQSLHKCPCFSMNATEAAVQLIRALCKESNLPLNEKELQRRLEIVYDDITTNTADIETMKSRIRALELQNQADSDSPKLVYDTANGVISALQVTKQKMEADYHLGNILWEIYHLMIEAGVATDSSKESFEEKPRKAKRINDLIINNTILLKEIEHAEELISRAAAVKRNSYVDFPDEKSIAESLSRIENMLRSPRPTLDYVETVDQRLQNL
ncbi:unnamed protein product [Heligmosomoides polygyrus]|uniref:DUF1758 domain-containing protein n=1 Tax=Heligmosomoides polygyrus TaxID=6339 RepID=A0A183GGF4_HELPZ|nr:unnamed protein product [Heligmosomoides polygyrus]